jgi:hypothetical protein
LAFVTFAGIIFPGPVAAQEAIVERVADDIYFLFDFAGKLSANPRRTPRAAQFSITSPLAHALIGNRKGVSFEVATPGGAKVYKIQKVEWR